MRQYPLLAACFLVLVVACERRSSPLNPEPTAFQSLVDTQYHTYPEMQLQDWYKLFHQAAMGNRHLGVADSLIFNYMIEELNSIEADENESLLEYISPDSSVVRLNLRPYKALGGAPEPLFAVMKGTWEHMMEDPDQLAHWGEALADYATQASPGFTTDEISDFFNTQQAAGFPAMHHSDVYMAVYAPAYRVLERDLALTLLADYDAE